MSSETNVQLFPGVFRTTQGGTTNPDFFLHSSGRVGIGNTAPATRPVWSSDDNDRNKLNVSGHTHIEGNLNVSGFVYGNGSNLTGTALPWQQSTPNLATDIKYEGGNVGIGGGASSTNILKVHGTVEATSFVEGGTAISSTYATQTALTNGLSGKQDAGSTINLGTSSSIRQTSTTWTGNPGTQGKLEYHSNRWYIVAGSNSNELVRFRRDGTDKCFITNEGNLGRSSYSSGYLIGGQNNIGGTDTKTNPIYTIGSSHMPSDTSLGDMYGIGYSHGHFTSMLTGGWGMYVAADGDIRIGLNATHGYIKNTSHIYCGGAVYLSGTGQGLHRSVGDYGTVQTTGGGNNGWEGYSIDGRYVFMSADNNSCGIYNDIDNEWMIYCERNGNVRLYDNGSEKLQISPTCEFSTGGLRIYGYESNFDYTDPQADYFTNGGSIQAETPYALYGLYVQYHIRSEGIAVFSDERIKRDFMEIDDTFALDKLRQLKPTSYRYKDVNRNTRDRVLGFIAQEVAEVLPDAVSISKGVLPNIQLEASVKKIDEEKFEFTLKKPHSVKVGAKLEIKAPKLDHMEVDVISVSDDTTFTVLMKKFDIDKVGDRVIVYGEYVDDFHNLDKNAIWTVATAALQEVDRQLQAEKEKVKSLEERLAALEAIVLNQ